MSDLYAEHILDHASHPRNKREMVSYSAKIDATNPSCGDALTLYFKFSKEGVIEDISFYGYGCALSQASASLLTEHIKGKTVDSLRLLTPGDIYSLLQIEITPARVKCALLCYSALEELFRSGVVKGE